MISNPRIILRVPRPSEGPIVQREPLIPAFAAGLRLA